MQRFDELCWALWIQYFVTKSPRDANYCERCNSQLLLLGKSAMFVTCICHHILVFSCRRKKTPLSLAYLNRYRNENSKRPNVKHSPALVYHYSQTLKNLCLTFTIYQSLKVVVELSDALCTGTKKNHCSKSFTSAM